MKRSLPIASISAFILLSTSSIVHATNISDISSLSVSEICEPVVTASPEHRLREACADYISGYFDGVIMTNAIYSNAKQKFDSASEEQIGTRFSAYEQRALQTRAHSHMQRLDRQSLIEACNLSDEQQQAHIDSLALKLGYIDDKKMLFADSISRLLKGKHIC